MVDGASAQSGPSRKLARTGQATPLVAHWGLPDPAAVCGSDAEKRAAFMDAYRKLASRITAFVNLDIGRLDLASLKERLAEIGRMEGATEMALRAA
ncbi:MAG: hypothetical protein ACHQAQ_03665 [Hyphomicrobiales bacterium]